jgi:hypothetical protein
MEASGQLHSLTALRPGKEPPYPLDRKMGGPPQYSTILTTKNFSRDSLVSDYFETESPHLAREYELYARAKEDTISQKKRSNKT